MQKINCKNFARCISLSIFPAFLNLVVVLGHLVIRHEFIILTKFKMHAEDAIVSGVRRKLQKVQENFPSHYNVHTRFGAYSDAIQWLRGGGSFPQGKVAGTWN